MGLIVLWLIQGQAFDQGQLAALYSQQQHLSQQHLQLGSLTDSEQAFSLQDAGMQSSWHNSDLSPGPWMS